MCLDFYIAWFSFSSLYSVFMDAVLFMVLSHSLTCHVWLFMKHHRHPEALWKERVFPAWGSVLVCHAACSFIQNGWMPIVFFKTVYLYWGPEEFKTRKATWEQMQRLKGDRGTSLLATNTHSSFSLPEPSTFETLIPTDTGSLLLSWLHVFTCSENIGAERVTDLGWPQMSFSFLLM